MRHLLDDRLSPITDHIGFLKAPIQTLVTAFQAWQDDILESEGRHTIASDVSGDLEFVLRSILPFTAGELRRYLFLPTTSHWTAFIDNQRNLPDIVGPVAVLAKNVGCSGLRALSVPNTIRLEGNTWRGRYGGVILELFRETTAFGQSSTLRSIAAVNDGGSWAWNSFGEYLPFERPDAYRVRRVRDRFTEDMLVEYCASLGIHLFDEQFYAPQRTAVLVSKVGPIYPGVQEYTLEQVQAAQS